MPSWPRSESPGKRKLIFPSLKVDMLVLMVSTFWVVSFFHSVSTSTYHSPSWTWNPEKKNHTFQVRNLRVSFLLKSHFSIPYILELWLGKIVFSMVPEIWSFFLTRLPEFCPSQLVCLQNFGPWTTTRTTIFLSSMLIGTFVSLYVTWCNMMYYSQLSFYLTSS